MNTLKDLKFDKRNARKHNPRNIGMIEKSLNEVGAGRSIVIDEDNNILAGNGTIEAAQQAGINNVQIVESDGNTIIAVRRTGLSDEQKKKLALYDNRTAETAEWDEEVLAELSQEIDLSDMFSEKELQEITGVEKEIEEDEIPEVPKQAKTVLGDLYELGRHRLLCGDSTNSDDVAKLCGENRFDMVVTDPPYNVDYVGKTKDALKIQNDKKKDGDFYQFLYDFYTSFGLFSKQGGAWYVWHADTEGLNFRKAFIECGFKLSGCLIWKKQSMVMGRSDYQWQHEPCLYGWKEGASHSWYADRKQTTILEFDRPSRSEEHPTMKPVELIAYQIKNSSKQGDIVGDGFLGSGTTLMASEQLGRSCYGIELDPKYCDVIVSRYVKFTGNNKIKRNGIEIEWEV